jgi:hypothetical protein
MANESVSVTRHSPDKLLTRFEHSPLLMFLVVSLVAHVVILGAMSTGYIHDRYILGKTQEEIDQARADARKAKVEQAKPAAPAVPAPAPAAAAPAPAPDATSATAAGGAAAPAAGAVTPDGGAKPREALTDAELMEKHKDTTVIKRVTEAAKPEELPKKPDELGISIEETNRF